MRVVFNFLSRIFIVSILTGASSPAMGLDLDPNEIRGKSSKEPLTVLQNRYFLKSYRPEFGILAGTLLDEAYLSTRTTGVRMGMFFNEWLGVDIAVIRTQVGDSVDRKALNRLKYRPLNSSPSQGDAVPTDPDRETVVSPDPEINPLRGAIDFSAVAAPFYGKLNFIDKFIVYTDLYGQAGMARVDTDQGPKNALILGAGERFYIGRSWSIRIDFKDRIFTESRAGVNSRRNSYGVDLGASYFFN